MLNLDFSGKIALVTGGTRGIGQGIVKLLLTEGCEVIYTGVKELSDDSNQGGRYAQLNLADDQNIKKFVAEIIEPLPRVDILVNNAGITVLSEIDQIKDEDWEKVIKVNLTGPMSITRAVVPIMKRAGQGGKILNISSIWGVISKSKRDAYSASKSGLIGLTRACALDLAPYNILVNALCPGFVNTELTRTVLNKDEMEKLSAQVPLKRFAEISDIASVAVFLCSDINTYMTGQVVIVDGGFTII